ncbi:ISL3 family transposase [Pseudodesulfovibrio piezophilus]|uniref:Transposase n=1 Tax=Pseudodesulfovibrio piezophilus (strain DSM 21447 / JCM 15486 / C1TLV30) TaxID=1322246 RepID=M1WJA0_PSEP2|nr:ISL3 family transposase [Pseudodesulfovibrio piezophilus]CCH47531.1 transposase [Pseudodesulfovibrio piezophilus C1TLV30]
MTIQDVPDLLGIGWDTIKSIFKRYLVHRFSKPYPGELKYVAINEISVRKGQKSLTLVMDLENGAVVFGGEGRSRETLLPFWERLKKTRAKITAVAKNVNASFISAFMENLSNTAIVFDWFHVVKLMNEKITQIRHQLFRKLASPLERKEIKVARWIFLKKRKFWMKATMKRSAATEQTFGDSLLSKRGLAATLVLVGQGDGREGHQRLDRQGRNLRDTPFSGHDEDACRILFRHPYYDHPILSGPIEGTNNKIKTLKRQAYGYRDTEFFKLRIMRIPQAKYALAG